MGLVELYDQGGGLATMCSSIAFVSVAQLTSLSKCDQKEWSGGSRIDQLLSPLLYPFLLNPFPTSA